MKKLKKLGEILNKEELQSINGGGLRGCDPRIPCPFAPTCDTGFKEECCECVPCVAGDSHHDCQGPHGH